MFSFSLLPVEVAQVLLVSDMALTMSVDLEAVVSFWRETVISLRLELPKEAGTDAEDDTETVTNPMPIVRRKIAIAVLVAITLEVE